MHLDDASCPYAPPPSVVRLAVEKLKCVAQQSLSVAMEELHVVQVLHCDRRKLRDDGIPVREAFRAALGIFSQSLQSRVVGPPFVAQRKLAHPRKQSGLARVRGPQQEDFRTSRLPA
jgi:hypothetical protein